MSWHDSLFRPFRPQPLSTRRIVLAFVIAGLADVLQFFLLPFSLLFFDDIIDVMAMVPLLFILGFHPLLLPTFLIELIPIIDAFPTWTGCVALVVAMRRRQPRTSPIIDVEVSPVGPSAPASGRRADALPPAAGPSSVQHPPPLPTPEVPPGR